MARRRGLEDVLHHFISEDEQREAREQARGTPTGRSEAGPAAGPARWVLAASPRRPLSCSLALDLAAALSRDPAPGGSETLILAPFPAGIGARRSTRWVTLPAGGGAALREALEAAPEDASTLALVSPEQLGSVLGGLDGSRISGVLLLVDAAAWGLTRALGWLRGCSEALAGVRIGAVVVGADDRELATDLYDKLASAARRQLGLRLESFGEIERDAASFRSLLLGVSVLDLDSAAASSRSLESLCRRLAAPPGGAAEDPA